MEDCESIKSNESVSTSDEFDFVSEKPSVSKVPTLNIVKGGTLNDLKLFLSDAMQDSDNTTSDLLAKEPRKVSGSIFYQTLPVEPGMDPLSAKVEEANVSPTEKQDEMKPDSSDEEGKYQLLYWSKYMMWTNLFEFSGN